MKGNKISRIGLKHMVVSLAILGVFVGQANLAIAASFNQSLVYSSNPDASAGVTLETTNQDGTLASNSYSTQGDWGSASAYASADLSTGQLKIQAGASTTTGYPNWPYMISNATFGDSFTTTSAGGTPFTWNASTATFNLALNGTYDAMFGPPDPNSNAGSSAAAFAVLIISHKGTLDPNNLLNSNMIQYFLWGMGNPNPQLAYNDGQTVTPLTVTAGYDYIPTTLSATFAPGGDFDWALILGASGQVINAGDYFDVDLSHTLTLGYVGPEGGITTSDSGIFKNISPASPTGAPVPEPATMLLFGTGIAGLAAAGRRKRS